MDFKILSLKEEEKLSKEELLEYYTKLREYIKNRKLTNTTPGATVIGPILKGVTTEIAKVVTKAFTNDNVELICEGYYENVPAGTAIFAHTHVGILDNFIWIPEVDRHCMLLHGQEVNKLLLLCQINTGLILVKKGDKENNNNAKLDMIRLLLEGHSITYFPEGTWNLSPNKLHLPMSFGIIDIAKKAGVPIIPVAHEYTYDTSSDKEKIIKVHSKYGKPIYVSECDSLISKLEDLSTSLSTMKFELIEAKGLFSRSDITNFDYINFLKGSYKNLKLGKLDLDKERRYIFGANDYFYEYHHINAVPFTEDGRLLDAGFEEKRYNNLKKRTLNKK